MSDNATLETAPDTTPRECNLCACTDYCDIEREWQRIFDCGHKWSWLWLHWRDNCNRAEGLFQDQRARIAELEQQLRKALEGLNNAE